MVPGKLHIDPWYLQAAKKTEHPVIIFSSAGEDKVWFANEQAEELARMLFFGEDLSG